MNYCFDRPSEVAKALNELAWHQMLERLMRDILIDITVSQLEGWNYREYLEHLKELIDGILGG